MSENCGENSSCLESMIKSLTNRGKNKRQVKLVQEKVLQFAFGASDSEDDEDFVLADKPESGDDNSDDSAQNQSEEEEEEADDESDTEVEVVGTNLSNILEKVGGRQPVSAVKTEEENIDEDEMEVDVNEPLKPFLVCGICLESDQNENDEILECDNCGICVHEGCYGDIDLADDDTVDSDAPTEPWFCEPCKADVKGTSICELCPNMGGIYKQTDTGRWVHLVCALYTPDVGFRDVSKLQTVVLEDVRMSSWGARECTLCPNEEFNKTGVCIECDAGMCRTPFHVTCAQRNGFLSDIPTKDDDTTDGEDESEQLYAHCKLHSVKDSVRTRRTSWLAFQSRVSKFQRSTTDSDRVKHALERARQEYREFRRTVPLAQQIPNFQRMFSSCPEACMMLAKKAEFLGIKPDVCYNVNAAIVSGKVVKFDPNLSAEFVNHFFKREMLIADLQQKIKQAGPLGESLQREQKKLMSESTLVREQLDRVVESKTETRNVLTTLHSLLAKVAGGRKIKQLKILQPKKSEVTNSKCLEDSKELLSTIVKSCATCKSTEEQHTLAYCGKCKNNYHMKCLDPPLLRLPKTSDKYVWQCTECDSSDESENDADLMQDSVDAEGKRRTKRKFKNPEKFTPEPKKMESDSEQPAAKKKAEAGEKTKKAKKSTTPTKKKTKQVASGNVKKDGTKINKRGPKKNEAKKVEKEEFTDCVTCNKPGGEDSLVKCDECKQCYHFKTCLDPPSAKSPKGKYWGWICEECDETGSEEESDGEEPGNEMGEQEGKKGTGENKKGTGHNEKGTGNNEKGTGDNDKNVKEAEKGTGKQGEVKAEE